MRTEKLTHWLWHRARGLNNYSGGVWGTLLSWLCWHACTITRSNDGRLSEHGRVKFLMRKGDLDGSFKQTLPN